MKKSIIIAVFLGALVSNPLWALDLTPHEIKPSVDGPPAKRYFFQDGQKQLCFRIDSKMTVGGTSDSLAFQFDNIPGAKAKLIRSRTTPEIPFDEKNLESYRSAARSFLPSDATEIQLEAEKPNAIAINGWTSQQFIFSYNRSGSPCRASVTFINYSEKEQLVFEADSPSPDYEKAYIRSYRVLNSISDRDTANAAGPT